MRRLLYCLIALLLFSCKKDDGKLQWISYSGNITIPNKGIVTGSLDLRWQPNGMPWGCMLCCGEIGQPHDTYDTFGFTLENNILTLPLNGTKCPVEGLCFTIDDLSKEIPIQYIIDGDKLTSIPNASGVVMEMKEEGRYYEK